MIRLKISGGAIMLPVKVVPGASRTKCVGEWHGRVRISVAAVAENGKANRALLNFLAEFFGVRKTQLSVVFGETQPQKIVQISGVDPSVVLNRLSDWGCPAQWDAKPPTPKKSGPLRVRKKS